MADDEAGVTASNIVRKRILFHWDKCRDTIKVSSRSDGRKKNYFQISKN